MSTFARVVVLSIAVGVSVFGVTYVTRAWLSDGEVVFPTEVDCRASVLNKPSEGLECRQTATPVEGALSTVRYWTISRPAHLGRGPVLEDFIPGVVAMVITYAVVAGLLISRRQLTTPR